MPLHVYLCVLRQEQNIMQGLYFNLLSSRKYKVRNGSAVYRYTVLLSLVFFVLKRKFLCFRQPFCHAYFLNYVSTMKVYVTFCIVMWGAWQVIFKRNCVMCKENLIWMELCSQRWGTSLDWYQLTNKKDTSWKEVEKIVYGQIRHPCIHLIEMSDFICVIALLNVVHREPDTFTLNTLPWKGLQITEINVRHLGTAQQWHARFKSAWCSPCFRLMKHAKAKKDNIFFPCSSHIICPKIFLSKKNNNIKIRLHE